MMYKAGVFNPIIERVVEQYLIEDLSSGREDLQEVVLSKIDENKRVNEIKKEERRNLVQLLKNR